jgi:hypothetical protein
MCRTLLLSTGASADGWARPWQHTSEQEARIDDGARSQPACGQHLGRALTDIVRNALPSAAPWRREFDGRER